jgi:hypothetical protein
VKNKLVTKDNEKPRTWTNSLDKGPKRKKMDMRFEGQRSLGRPRGMWVDNINIDLGEIGWGGMDWIGLAQDRHQWSALVDTVMTLRIQRMLGSS